MRQPSSDVPICGAAAGDADAALMGKAISVVCTELEQIIRQSFSGTPKLHASAGCARPRSVSRTIEQTNIRLENPFRLLGIAAQLAGGLLVHYAIRLCGEKPEVNGVVVALTHGTTLGNGATVDVLILDAALSRLARSDPQQCCIEALRLFGGLSIYRGNLARLPNLAEHCRAVLATGKGAAQAKS